MTLIWDKKRINIFALEYRFEERVQRLVDRGASRTEAEAAVTHSILLDKNEELEIKFDA